MPRLDRPGGFRLGMGPELGFGVGFGTIDAEGYPGGPPASEPRRVAPSDPLDVNDLLGLGEIRPGDGLGDDSDDDPDRDRRRTRRRLRDHSSSSGLGRATNDSETTLNGS